MSLLNLLSYSLPEGISIGDLKNFVSEDILNEYPEKAIILALRRSGKFDTKDYIDRYTDVKDTRIDPIEHFVKFGIKEQRYFRKKQKTPEDNACKNFNNYTINRSNSFQDLKNKFFSIIITCYNNNKYITNAIQSALNQSFYDCELIVIDDYSQDRSLQTINTFKNKITLISHKENMGAYIARKHGILHSTGKYILFLDGDDELDVNICSNLHKHLIRCDKEVDIAHFSTEIRPISYICENKLENIKKQIDPRIQNKCKVISYEYLTKEIFENNLMSYNLANKCIRGEIARKSILMSPDCYIQRGNDTYMLFVISSISKNYFPIKHITGYKYNYGAGLYGNDKLNIYQYNKLLSLFDTYRLMKEFELEYYNKSTISNIIYHKYWRDAGYRLVNFVDTADIYESFNLLIKKYGLTSAISTVSYSLWNLEPKHFEKINLFFNNKYRKKRIVKNIGIFYNRLSIGGIQNVMIKYANIYHDLGYNVYIIVSETHEIEFALPHFVKLCRIRSYKSKDDYCNYIDDLYDVITDNNIDFIHYNRYASNQIIFEILLFHYLGIYTAVHIHGTFYTFLYLKMARLDVICRTLSYADCLIAMNFLDKHFWQSFNLNTCHIQNPSISFREYKKIISNNILFIGRISPEKRIEDIIEAFKIIQKNINNTRLIIVGDSDNLQYKNKLKKLVEKYELNNIFFEGYKLETEKYYRDAAVFVLTSKYEGYSQVLSEAKIYGLPIVMYNLNHLDLVKDGRGVIIVDKGDINELAIQISKILLDNQYRDAISKSSYSHGLELSQYDIKKDVKKMIEKLYSNDKKYENNTKSEMIQLLIDEIYEAKK